MSKLTQAQFDSTYNDAAGGSFPDNTVRAITEAIVRQFAEDIKDSVIWNYPITEVTGSSTVSASGIYLYTGTGGHTLTINDSLDYVAIFNASTNSSDLTLSGEIFTSFGTTLFYGNPTRIFRWASAISKYIF